MKISIYQVNPEKSDLSFMNWNYTEAHGGINPSAYQCVYHGYVEAENLEDVFRAFNEGFLPPTHQGHSLSVSDVLEIEDEHGAGSEFHFCDSIGWKDIAFDKSAAEEMAGLRVLMLQPNCPPAETRVKDGLASWQHAVSSHGEDSLIEVTYPFDDNCLIVSNEESKLIGMPGNRRINGSVFAGPMFIVGDNGSGNFCDLSDEQIAKYSAEFANPETISDEEVEDDTGFMIFGI